MLTGGCLCAAVRYEIGADPMFAAHCHCRDCQKATGTGHVSVIGAPKAAFKLTGAVKGYAVTGGSGNLITRYFCPECGSLLYGEPEHSTPPRVHVTAGTLDDPSIFKPQVAIYTRDRHAWDVMPGDLMEFETAPPVR